ncbi:hypothetical protein ASD62_11150 [Phycicoccus sp. Root563]|nr:hypothetical protein ASD62_11150 [Phycicoccus sp. Root563]
MQAKKDEAFAGLATLAEDVTYQVVDRLEKILIEASKGQFTVERDARKIFVVHGRNAAYAAEIKGLLRRLGLSVLEWEMAVGMTGVASPYIGDIVQAGMATCGATLVLFTPDDEVRLSPELVGSGDGAEETELRRQARPNVFYEAGIADALDKSSTLLVEAGSVKSFSDISGRHVVRYDGSARAKKIVAERLRACGAEVDTSGTDWLE